MDINFGGMLFNPVQWSHDFKYHLCIIDSQMYICSPHLIPAVLPRISCSLYTSTHMPNHHFWLTVFLMDSHSSAFVLPFLCKWHTSLCNWLLSPKTLEVSLDSFFSTTQMQFQQITLTLILNYIQNLFTSHDLHPYHLNPNHYQLSATTGASDFIFYHAPTALFLTNWKSEFILARIRTVSAVRLGDSQSVILFRPSLTRTLNSQITSLRGFFHSWWHLWLWNYFIHSLMTPIY